MQLDRAIQLAAQCHRGRLDKAGAPYILHVLRVVAAVWRQGDDAQCAAALHDVVENGHVPLILISVSFGDRIAEAVDALTRRDHESYADYIQRVAERPLAVIVKRADLRDNLDRLDVLPTSKADSLARRYTRALATLEEVG